MNVAYVNPFVQGAQRVFATVCQETPSLGKVFVKPVPYTASPVSVSVTIRGAFEGEVVYNFDEAAGCHIASRMMQGMPVPSLDAMAKSALSELANMISGNVCTLFSGKNMIIDINPPQLRHDATHADFPMAAKVDKVVCVPLTFSNNAVFQVDVMIPG